MLEFVETPGAGVYTAKLPLLAGQSVLSAQYWTTSAWAADTAHLAQADLGFNGTVKSTGNTGYFGIFGYDSDPWVADTDVELEAVVTTTGAGGTTGRTLLAVAVASREGATRAKPSLNDQRPRRADVGRFDPRPRTVLGAVHATGCIARSADGQLIYANGTDVDGAAAIAKINVETGAVAVQRSDVLEQTLPLCVGNGRVYTSDGADSVQVLDADTLELIDTFNPTSSSVYSGGLALSPDETKLYVASRRSRSS